MKLGSVTLEYRFMHNIMFLLEVKDQVTVTKVEKRPLNSALPQKNYSRYFHGTWYTFKGQRVKLTYSNFR